MKFSVDIDDNIILYSTFSSKIVNFDGFLFLSCVPDNSSRNSEGGKNKQDKTKLWDIEDELESKLRHVFSSVTSMLHPLWNSFKSVIYDNLKLLLL